MEIKNITPNDITKEVIDLVKAYIVQKAVAETKRQVVDVIANKLAESFEFVSHREGSQIINHRRLYLSNDEEKVDAFFVEVDKKLKEAGVKPLDMEWMYCPALVEESKLMEIEAELIYQTGIMYGLDDEKGELNNTLLCQKDGLKKRQEFIDNVIGLVLCWLDKESE